MYKVLAVVVMFSFEEDDGGARGKVGVRLGDVVGEGVAYLAWRA